MRSEVLLTGCLLGAGAALWLCFKPSPAGPADTQDTQGPAVDATQDSTPEPPRGVASLEELTQRLEELNSALLQAEPEQRKGLVRRFAESLYATEIGCLLGHRQQLVESGLSEEVAATLLHRLARLEPESAAVFVDDIPAGPARAAFLVEIAALWRGRQPEAGRAWMRGLLETPPLPEASVLLNHIWNFNPEEAREWLLALPSGGRQDELVDMLVTPMGRSNFDQVLAWAKELPNGQPKSRSLVHLSYRWAERDMAGALQYAVEAGQGQMASVLIRKWAERDPAAAAEWVAQVPHESLRERLLSGLTATWAQQAPVAAAGFVATLPPGPAQDNAAISVVSAWASQNAPAALEWVERFPKGGTREQALENVFFQWAHRDPAEAALRLQTAPAGRERDIAVHAFVGRIFGQYPEVATAWAETIGDTSLRDRQLKRAAQAWVECAPDQAPTSPAQR